MFDIIFLKIMYNKTLLLLPRSQTSLLMKMCAQRKARRRQRVRRRFASRLYPSHGPLRFITSHSFRARLCHAKNEAPEEEAVIISFGFCDVWNNQGLSKFYQPQPSAYLITLTLTIPDITKTSCNIVYNNQIVQNNTSFGNRKVEHKGDFYST